MPHPTLIRALVDEIRRLRDQIHSLQETAAEIDYRIEERTNRLRHELQDVERAAEKARWETDLRDWQRQSALKDLERARSYDDEWGESRALDKLRRLG